MPLWMNFCASAIEVLTVIILITLLDEKNTAAPCQILCITLLECGLALLLDVWDVGFHMIYILALFIALFYTFTKNKLLNIAIDVTLSYVFYTTLQMIASVALFYFVGNVSESPCALFLFLLSYLFIAYLAMKRCRGICKFRQYYHNYRESIASLALCALLFDFIMIYFWRKYNEIFFHGRWVLLALQLLNYVLMGIIFWQFFGKRQEKNKRELEEEYNEYLQNKALELSRQKHEYANHLNVIAGLLETSKTDNLDETLSFIEELLQKKENRKHHPFLHSDRLTAAMLCRKKKEAETLGIHFGHLIPSPFPQYPLSSHDLLEILSNLLNNAFEAQLSLPVSCREVFLNLNENSIEVLNAVSPGFDPQQIQSFSQIGFSTKENGRGYGVANVKRIVDRAQGKLDIYLQEETLVFFIYFP